MYKIDWESYLSTDRKRTPESNVGKNKPVNSYDFRNEFESDFGRVVFCSAARRMHDKTQVFPLTSGDYVHTRLTHSIEVLNIAQSLGSSLCRNEQFVTTYGKEQSFELEKKIVAVLRTAAFMHDIGNPPFGHYGEETIKQYFKENGSKYLKGTEETDKMLLDFCEFDGNAEGFRIITKTQFLGDLVGLNLTYATLGAYLKYPNIGHGEEKNVGAGEEKSEDKGKKDKKYIGTHKHGIFYSERDVFDSVVEHLHLRVGDKIKRHPLSFLVEAADTICYTAMDLEDGIQSGRLDFAKVRNNINIKISEFVAEKDSVGKILSDRKQQEGYKAFLEALDSTSVKDKDVVNFRVYLISYLVTLSLENFITNLESIDNGSYNNELVKDDPLNIVKIIGKYLRANLYNCSEVISAELTGAAVIRGLLDIVLPPIMSYDNKEYKDKRFFEFMSTSLLELVKLESKTEDKIENLPPYYRLRLVIDWISGMTDKYALETYQKLSGIKL